MLKYIYIYIPKSPCSFLQAVSKLQSSPKLPQAPPGFRAPLALRKHCTCRQIRENGSPRPPKTTQDHRNHRHQRNRSKTLLLSTNPRKRFSAVTSWRSKTLHLSTNPRKRHSKTLHLSTNPRKRLSGVTGRSNGLLRSHWALESAAPGPLGARNHCCQAFEITINCARIGCSGVTGRSKRLR